LQRLAMAHFGELADHLVNKFEPRLSIEVPADP
jgi:hypothetical protein